MDLLDTIRRLYASEINCGIQSEWHGGVRAWIGDHLNGHHAERMFGPLELADLPCWLGDEARRLYPQSNYARRP